MSGILEFYIEPLQLSQIPNGLSESPVLLSAYNTSHIHMHLRHSIFIYNIASTHTYALATYFKDI